MAAAADEVRRELAPFQVVQDIRIMERRKGLSKPVAQQFRAAIALTKTDEGAACDLFASLEPDAPSHPSLQFNLGLCAEQIGDFERARAYYDAALADKSSDDEAQAGIFRLQSNIAAERQLAMRVD